MLLRGNGKQQRCGRQAYERSNDLRVGHLRAVDQQLLARTGGFPPTGSSCFVAMRANDSEVIRERYCHVSNGFQRLLARYAFTADASAPTPSISNAARVSTNVRAV